MDTSTGEVIQVVDNAEQIAKLKESVDVTDKIMADKQEQAEPAKTEPAKKPAPNCRRCHGRGHLGKDLKTGNYLKCVCVLNEDEAKARRCRIQAEELHHLRFGRK